MSYFPVVPKVMYWFSSLREDKIHSELEALGIKEKAEITFCLFAF
jgi:hypothetical protein